MNFGIFEMQSYQQLKESPAYQAWISGDNESNVPPQGESGAQMKKRVLEALDKIGEDTCIVTHGGVIAAIMEHLYPEEKKNRYQWQPENGRGYVIEGSSYACIP